MKFYEVHTEEGPQLVGTQGEVKKLKQPIRIHEVPTDKDALMAYVNDLRRRPSPSVDVQPVAVVDKAKDYTIKEPPTPEEVFDFILESEGSELRGVFECLVEKLNRKIRKAGVNDPA